MEIRLCRFATVAPVYTNEHLCPNGLSVSIDLCVQLRSWFRCTIVSLAEMHDDLSCGIGCPTVLIWNSVNAWRYRNRCVQKCAGIDAYSCSAFLGFWNAFICVWSAFVGVWSAFVSRALFSLVCLFSCFPGGGFLRHNNDDNNNNNNNLIFTSSLFPSSILASWKSQ